MSSKLLGRSFIFLWLSETAFDIGSALMGFALGVWVFEQSGSVQQFSYAILSSAVPSLICIPIAGVLADRFDRRWVIALCDCAAALMVLVLAYLLFHKLLVVEHLYVVGAVGGVIGALRNPSYQAAVAMIVPKEKLTQANGLIGSTQGILQIGAPLAAGYLMAAWGLEGVMIIEVVMVLAGAIAVFAALTSASHAIRGSSSQVPLTFLASIRDSVAGVRKYFSAHSLMISLAVYILIQEALLILSSTMLTPLVLANHSSDTLGVVMTLGAFGGVAGSLILVGTNLKKHLMLWVLASDVGLAGFVVLAGFANTAEIWCLCAFGAFAFGSVSEGCAGALWMRKVPKEKQGSVFASIGAANLVVMCVVLLVGSTFAEQVFEPLMMPGASLAESFGPWLGVGKGRGVALLFVLAGTIFATVSFVAMFHPRLRKLDDLVPDQAHPDENEIKSENEAVEVAPVPEPVASRT